MDDRSNYSQMSVISHYNLNNYNPDLSFQMNLNNNNIDDDELLNSLFDSLDKNLSESFKTLTQCFICLTISNNPLACPKCNNFACKKCFLKYFGNSSRKECPLCKQLISKSELKQKKIINQLEKIMSKNDTRENKIKELSDLINDQKYKWDNEGNEKVNNMINKMLKYQDYLKDYRNEYDNFFIEVKTILDETFDKYENKIKEIINSLTSYNSKYNLDFKKRIMDCIEKDKKKKKDNKSNNDRDNVSFLVREIVSMEREHFNEEKRENEENEENGKYKTENFILERIVKNYNEFLSKPPIIMPNLSYYSPISIDLSKKDLNEEYIKKKGYNVHVGDFEIKFKFRQDNFYSVLCKFYLKNNKNAIYLINQKKKLLDSKSYEIIPMKLSSKNSICTYSALIDLEEFKNNSKSIINMETKIQIFSMINN